MRGLRMLLLSNLFACAVEHEIPSTNPTLPPDVNVSTRAVPDIRCAGTPDVGATTAWRHTISDYTVQYGAPHHRGIDLITTTDDATQTLTGKIAYGITDKDLED